MDGCCSFSPFLLKLELILLRRSPPRREVGGFCALRKQEAHPAGQEARWLLVRADALVDKLGGLIVERGLIRVEAVDTWGKELELRQRG